MRGVPMYHLIVVAHLGVLKDLRSSKWGRGVPSEPLVVVVFNGVRSSSTGLESLKALPYRGPRVKRS